MTFDCFPHDFFLPPADEVAPKLLGHIIWRKLGDEWVAGTIVEVEAYIQGDPASHAYNRRTPRTEPMYGPPGQSYVYLIYGYYHCLNIVCQPEGIAEAVLIRALEPAENLDVMRRNRPVLRDRDLLNGPGKICQAMNLTKAENSIDMCTQNGQLVLERRPDWEEWTSTRGPIIQTTRIGLTKAADLPLRWYLQSSKSVSRYG